MYFTYMKAVFTALSDGLPCPVSRYWPQDEAPLPSCAFRLSNWTLNEGGGNTLEILVSLRVKTPSEGDALTQDAITALDTLLYKLVHAVDAREEDTGFFLRHLTFRLLVNVPEPQEPPPTPEEQYPFTLRVHDASTASWAYLPTPLAATFEPARRPVHSVGSLSSNTTALPQVRVQNYHPGTLSLSCPYALANAALAAFQVAFHAGNEVTIIMRYRFSSNFRAVGTVTAFHASPLGVLITLALSREFTQI